MAEVTAVDPIKTYVIIDTETTGIMGREVGPTKITELAAVAVLKEHIFDRCAYGRSPRVLNKLVACFHPQKFISSNVSLITGLTNDDLEDMSPFNKDFCDMFHLFLKRLPPPVCLLAHNGIRFDFPLLQAHFKACGKPLPNDILCADTYLTFKNLKVLEDQRWSLDEMLPSPDTLIDLIDEADREFLLEDMKMISREKPANFEYEVAKRQKLESGELFEVAPPIDETDKLNLADFYGVTPLKQEGKPPPSHAPIKKERQELRKAFCRRSLTFNGTGSPKKPLSYKLNSVYSHFFRKDIPNAHQAEADVMAIVEILSVLGEPAHNYIQEHSLLFNSLLKCW